MKDVNLVLDYSNMALRALYTCKYATSNKGSGVVIENFNTEAECGVLARKLCIDICYLVKLFSPSRVILACDSSNPWRSKIFSDIDNEGYKGTRTKDETKNWDNIKATWNDCKKYLANAGMIVCDINTAEADDIAAMWKYQSFADGSDVILVSSDADWRQLVSYDDEHFCICFNPIPGPQKKKNLYMTDEFSRWIGESSQIGDIFFKEQSSNRSAIRDLTKSDGMINFVVIDPEDVLINKIFCGDDSDNIPAMFSYYKGGRKTRITEKKKDKILESMGAYTLSAIINNIPTGRLQEAIETVMNVPIDFNPEVRMARQRQLVELNPTLFPKDIIDTFKYFVRDNAGKGSVSKEMAVMQNILQGTKYLTSASAVPRAKQNAIFDNLKDLEPLIMKGFNKF